MDLARKLGLFPCPPQFIFELGNEVDDVAGGLLNGLQLGEPLLLKDAFLLEEVLIKPKVELLTKEATGVFVDEKVNFGLPPENSNGIL